MAELLSETAYVYEQVFSRKMLSDEVLYLPNLAPSLDPDTLQGNRMQL